MIVIEELLCLSPMVLTILEVIEAGNFRFESGLNCRVLLQLFEKDIELLKFSN